MFPSSLNQSVIPTKPELCHPGSEPRIHFIPRGSATPVNDFEENRKKFADPTKPRQETRLAHPFLEPKERVQGRGTAVLSLGSYRAQHVAPLFPPPREIRLSAVSGILLPDTLPPRYTPGACIILFFACRGAALFGNELAERGTRQGARMDLVLIRILFVLILTARPVSFSGLSRCNRGPRPCWAPLLPPLPSSLSCASGL